MKTKEEIRSLVRQMLLDEFDRRFKDLTKRLPCKCIHNHRQDLDTSPVLDEQLNEGYNRLDRKHLPMAPTIGLCMLGSEDAQTWNGTICDEPIDAQRCPDFTPWETKESFLEDFTKQVLDPKWLETNLPVAYGLILASEIEPPFKLSWWKRLLFRLRIIKLEPVQPSFDVRNLLPEKGGSDVQGS
jgi:hypothetical protein